MCEKSNFNGTIEQEKELIEVIGRYKNEKGTLMTIMYEAQKIYGYLPIEVQKMIADNLQIPYLQVYEVATFFSGFNLNKSGKYKVGACRGAACYVKGSREILEKIEEILGIRVKETTEDGLFTIDDIKCMGCCSMAPVMMVNEDIYGLVKPEQVEGILDKYRRD